MRLYSVAVTALAVGAPIKWTDNLIAQHPIPDVRSRSRGVARGVSWAGVVRIALIRSLHVRLGCGVREAVALSEGLLRSAEGTVTLGEQLTLAVDRDALERDVQRQLAEALESAPRPRRGRPVRSDRDRGRRHPQG
jgi:hypothetical protein